MLASIQEEERLVSEHEQLKDLRTYAWAWACLDEMVGVDMDLKSSYVEVGKEVEVSSCGDSREFEVADVVEASYFENVPLAAILGQSWQIGEDIFVRHMCSEDSVDMGSFLKFEQGVIF